MKQLKRILHVEDVPSIQVVTRIALEKLGGFEVLSCQSGQAALDQVQAFAPDLILLDVMLPQMDGIETTAFIRSELDGAMRDVPVLGLTANVNPQDLERFKAAGLNDVLLKPFDPVQLCTQIEALILKRRSV